LKLVEFSQVLLQQQQERSCVLDGNAQAGAWSFIIAQLASYDECVEPNLQQPFVVSHRLQALNFNVIGLHAVAPGFIRGRYCQRASEAFNREFEA
jgi:hypothetical protein